MPMRNRIGSRSVRRAESSLTGQRSASITMPPVVDKAVAAFKALRTKYNTMRPGVVFPKNKSSLYAPGNLSIDHERVLPQKRYTRNLSIEYD